MSKGKGFFDELVQTLKQKSPEIVQEWLNSSSLFEEEPRDPSVQTEEVVAELRGTTQDQTDELVVLRALVIYREIVKHAKAGGQVKFVGSDGSLRTLRVRLR